METTHRINLILINLKAALTDRVPERPWAVEQVTAIVALQHKWIDE